jgi:precorrin-6B methylase 2
VTRQFDPDRHVSQKVFTVLRTVYGRFFRDGGSRHAASIIGKTRTLLRGRELALEARHDRRLGIDTSGRVPAGASQLGDAMAYEVIPYDSLALILRALRPQTADVLVDLGCGKGRAVCFFALEPLRKVIGVEFVPELAEVARRNVAALHPVTAVEIIEGDAATFDPSEGTIFYLFNPFGEATLSAVLVNLRRSLMARPRAIRIVYVIPELASLLDAAEWLVPEGELCPGTHAYTWRNTPLLGGTPGPS